MTSLSGYPIIFTVLHNILRSKGPDPYRLLYRPTDHCSWWLDRLPLIRPVFRGQFVCLTLTAYFLPYPDIHVPRYRNI
jgi:hypothetical protein